MDAIFRRPDLLRVLRVSAGGPPSAGCDVSVHRYRGFDPSVGCVRLRPNRPGASTTRAIINGVSGNTGLDIDLMTAIAEALGVAYGCVTAGTAVTSERETKAQFFPAPPQLWAVAGRRHHPATACAIRRRRARGGQQGNTSQPIAVPLGEQALHDRRTTDRYAEVKVTWVGGGQHSDQPARREYHSTRLAHEDQG